MAALLLCSDSSVSASAKCHKNTDSHVSRRLCVPTLNPQRFSSQPETWKRESASKDETKPFESDAAALNLFMATQTTDRP